MTINKFQGKTQEEAIAKAKEEFGERAVIMNIREVKPKGLFRAFKNSTFEVTAAMEEKEHFSNAMQAAQMTQSMAKEGKLHDMINLAADEPITIPKLQEQEGNAQAARQEPARMPQSQNLVQENEEKKLEERLEVLSDRLEKSLGGKNPKEPESTWTAASGQIKSVVNKVVFPAIDMILAIFFFVKLGTAYFDYRKTGQFEWTAPAILFACLVFTLTAPLYIWGIIGV